MADSSGTTIPALRNYVVCIHTQVYKSECGWTEGSVRIYSIPTENPGTRGTVAVQSVATLDSVSHGLRRPRHCLTRGKNMACIEIQVPRTFRR
jgi:hypothetical protein